MVEPPSSHIAEALKTQLIFSKISSCLPYKDLFSLMRSCKNYTQMGNIHLKMLLKQLNFSEDLEKNPQIQDYSHFLRFFYYREILNAQIPIPFENDLKVIRNNKLGFKGIQEFSIGMKLSGFLMYNKDLVVMETEKLNDVSNDKPEHLMFKSVRKFSTNAKNFIYLNEQSEVFMLIYEENSKLSSMKLQKLNLFFPVEDISVSFHHLILLSQIHEEISLKSLETPEFEPMRSYLKSNKSPMNIFILSFADLLNEVNFNEPTKILKIIDSEPIKKSLKSYCVGQHSAYFVNEGSNIFQVNLDNFAKEPLILPLAKHATLFGRHIEKVFSGLFYYFALETEEIKSIDSWDNAQVLKWSEEIGFTDYTQILKYENIVGSQLANVTKNFLIDTLGMNNVDLQNKFITEIHNNLKTRKKDQILYGWGNNNSGQLGLPACNIVGNPTKIQLPTLGLDDEIEKVECGWKMSCLLTKKHKLYISETSEKKQQNDFKPEEEKNLSKKAKKEEKKSHHPPPPEKKERPKWAEITHHFEKLKDRRTYTISNVSVGRESISVLGGFTGISKQVEQHEHHMEEGHEKKSKFRTAEYIINRIQWDPNLNTHKNDYRIGYEDRFLGTVEIEFEEFIAKSAEIKEHRIKYFKKQGEVFWDKNLKIDKF